METFQIRRLNYLITAKSVQKIAWENSDNIYWKEVILICLDRMNNKKVVTIDSIIGTKNDAFI